MPRFWPGDGLIRMRRSAMPPLTIPARGSRGYRLHTLLCRGSGLPLLFRLSPANVHDTPFARPLLELAVRPFGLRPRVVRLDAGHWGLKLNFMSDGMEYQHYIWVEIAGRVEKLLVEYGEGTSPPS